MKQCILIVKIILGNIFIALAVNLLIIPNSLVSGGSTGLVLTLQYFTHLDFSLLTALINIGAFGFGFIFLGKTFALTTLLSTFIYPIIVHITTPLTSLVHMTNEPLLAAICAGVLMGLGLGLVIGAGASTGGMDIPVIIVNRKLGISVSVAMYVMDTCILMSQILFSDISSLAYGIVLIATTTFTINQVIMVGKSECQVLTISNEVEKIRQAIIKDLDHGATLIKIETGYQRNDTKAVLCIIPNRELHILQKTILEIDPLAFMTISKIQEVRGRGFSLDKHLNA